MSAQTPQTDAVMQNHYVYAYEHRSRRTQESPEAMNTPELKRCPQCGSMECGPIRCRFSMREHVRRPEVDVDELDADPLDNEPDPRWDEDQYLDDPRRGQAAGLNRERGGRDD